MGGDWGYKSGKVYREVGEEVKKGRWLKVYSDALEVLAELHSEWMLCCNFVADAIMVVKTEEGLKGVLYAPYLVTMSRNKR